MSTDTLPSAGGSYLRDDDTGELVRVEPENQADDDAALPQPTEE